MNNDGEVFINHTKEYREKFIDIKERWHTSNNTKQYVTLTIDNEYLQKAHNPTQFIDNLITLLTTQLLELRRETDPTYPREHIGSEVVHQNSRIIIRVFTETPTSPSTTTRLSGPWRAD